VFIYLLSTNVQVEKVEFVNCWNT